MLASRPCLRDRFTQKVITEFAAEGLTSVDAKACLQVLALSTTPDTVSMEWSHSRMHRILTSVSQIQKPSIQYLNAQVLALQHRRRIDRSKGFPLGKRQRSAGVKRKLKGREEAGPKKQARGGGGAWRAWVSTRVQGQRGAIDMAALGREYRQAREARSQDYLTAVDVGRAGTVRRKATGERSFGPRMRDARRKRVRKQGRLAVTAEQGALLPVGGLAPREGDPDSVVAQFGWQQQLSALRRELIQTNRQKGRHADCAV